MRANRLAVILKSFIFILILYLITVGNESFTVSTYEFDLHVIILGVIILLILGGFLRKVFEKGDGYVFSNRSIGRFWSIFTFLIIITIILDIYMGLNLYDFMSQYAGNIISMKYVYVMGFVSMVYLFVIHKGPERGLLYGIAKLAFAVFILLIVFGVYLDDIYLLFGYLLETFGILSFKV